jgi:hypothetical protein
MGKTFLSLEQSMAVQPDDVTCLWPEGPPTKLEGVGPEIEFRAAVGVAADAAMLRNVSEPTLGNRSRRRSEQAANARGQCHRERAPECDARCTNRNAGATDVRSQPAQDREENQRGTGHDGDELRC